MSPAEGTQGAVALPCSGNHSSCNSAPACGRRIWSLLPKFALWGLLRAPGWFEQQQGAEQGFSISIFPGVWELLLASPGSEPAPKSAQETRLGQTPEPLWPQAHPAEPGAPGETQGGVWILRAWRFQQVPALPNLVPYSTPSPLSHTLFIPHTLFPTRICLLLPGTGTQKCVMGSCTPPEPGLDSCTGIQLEFIQQTHCQQNNNCCCF